MMTKPVILILFFVLYFVKSGNIHWENYPYCGGDTQSPRAIETNSLLDGTDICIPHTNWIIEHHTTWKIINTGHTIKLIPYNTTKNIATLPNQFNPIYDVNGEYCFDSFHFHWASNNDLGSEHTFDGQRFELEIHFVHYSCDYDNISMALAPSQNHEQIGDPYTLGVIGVMADNKDDNGIPAEDNHSFDLILNELPNIQYPANTIPGVAGEAIIYGFDIADILPQDRNQFYYYKGSLTTPPCNPIVRWHVLKNKITISNKQLAMLRLAMADTQTPESNNYRELQHNINPVYECMFNPTNKDNNNNNDHNNDHNNNEHEEHKGKVDQTTISMIIVGFIAIVAIIAVIVEFKNGAKRNDERAKRLHSVSHVSHASHNMAVSESGLSNNIHDNHHK